MNHREEDIRKLKACIEKGWVCVSCGGEGGEHTASDCPNEGDEERLLDEPEYENAFSAGKVQRGSYGATPTPEVLKILPKKPPRRR